MPQERIEGKFYPITASEITRLSSLLTDGEFKIYLYLMACNPFSDCSHPIDTAVIAENLGVTRRTAQRAVKKLDALGLIEIEISRFEYKRCEKATPGSPSDTRIAKRHQDRQATPGSPSDTKIAKRHQDRQATLGSPERHQDRPSDTRIAETTLGSPTSSKTRSGQGFSLSKTYTDFKDSLSEGEREKFFDFVGKEIKNFTRPISDLEAWLASETKAGEKRWQVYYEKFKEREEKARRSRPSLREEIEQRRAEVERILDAQEKANNSAPIATEGEGEKLSSSSKASIPRS